MQRTSKLFIMFLAVVVSVNALPLQPSSVAISTGGNYYGGLTPLSTTGTPFFNTPVADGMSVSSGTRPILDPVPIQSCFSFASAWSNGFAGALSLEQSASTYAGIFFGDFQPPQFFLSETFGEVSLVLSTGGPVRDGIIRYSGFSNIRLSPQGSSGSASLRVSNAPWLSADCSRGCTGSLATNGPVTAPFQLGVPFVMTLDGSFRSVASNATFDFTSYAIGRLNFNFELFEADARTWVELQYVPEPATWAGVLGALVLLGLGESRRRRSRR